MTEEFKLNEKDSSEEPRKSTLSSVQQALRDASSIVRRTFSEKILRKDATDTDEGSDDEQPINPSSPLLKSSNKSLGFNRIKRMWNNREVHSGFANPISHWPRSPLSATNPMTSLTTTGGNMGLARFTSTPNTAEEEKFEFFGVDVFSCPRERLELYAEPIPCILLLLRDELEKTEGFLVDGIFRLSAPVDRQKLFKSQIDDGSFRGCETQQDAIIIAALIKEWLQSLPTRLFNHLPVGCVREGKADLEKQLPEPYYSILMWLCDLIVDISHYEPINRMGLRAMSIVIAPSLYNPAPNATSSEILEETKGAVAMLEAELRSRSNLRQSI